jgi:hypothetical protein
MKSTPTLLAVVLASTALTATAAPAVAEQLTDPEPELGIAIGQVVLGSGVMVGAGLVAAAVSPAGPPGSLAVLAVAPALAGATVCWVGGRSAVYDDSCQGAVLGAYLGSLAILPGMFIGAWLGDNGEEDMSGALAVLGGMVVGYLIGPPVGATLGWHLGKQRRPPPAVKVGTAAPLQPRLLASSERARPRRAAGELTFPVLSLTF